MTVELYVVCVIDMLGHEEKLKLWSKLPSDRIPTPEFIRAMKQTVGPIEFFVQAFADYFEPFKAHAKRQELTPQQLEQYARFRDSVLKILQFSDTFIFYCPLTNCHGDLSVEPLYRMLTACCMGILLSLAGKAPLRGGICIGVGTTLKSGSFYGPALADAHKIEKKIAGYPRIVASREIVDFLAKQDGFSSDPTVELLHKEYAEHCRSLLYSDSDGQMTIDFLGDKFREMQDGVPFDMGSVARKAHQFVIDETTRFETSKNEKLLQRYRALLAYFEKHISRWG